MKSTMKLYIGVILLSICMSSGCGTDDPSYLFEVDHVFTITLPAGQNSVEDTVIPFRDIRSKIYDEIASRGLNIEDISGIYTAAASIDQISIDNDLSVVQGAVVNVYIGNNPTFNPYEAAYRTMLEDRFRERIRLIPSLTNLKDPLVNQEFNMELEINWRRISPIPIECIFSIRFGVEVN